MRRFVESESRSWAPRNRPLCVNVPISFVDAQGLGAIPVKSSYFVSSVTSIA